MQQSCGIHETGDNHCSTIFEQARDLNYSQACFDSTDFVMFIIYLMKVKKKACFNSTDSVITYTEITMLYT